MKRPGLLLLIIIWEFLTAFGALIAVSIVIAFAFPDAVDHSWESAAPDVIVGFSISILVLLCYIGIAITSGTGLLKGKEWGRISGIVHAALNVFLFPVGTVIGILSIIYLTRPEITDYVKANNKKQRA